MPKVKLVTGYVPIPGHPRGAEEYGELGERLGKVLAYKKAFYADIRACWLYKMVGKMIMPQRVGHSVGDNPRKNTMAYHIVNHQKTEWMAEAAREDPGPDIFVWMDYGILRIPGITEEGIREFLQNVNAKDIAIPGCWPRGPIDEKQVCWRFCGGIWVCPRKYIFDFDKAVKDEMRTHLANTRNVSWEVNTWARVEQLDLVDLPIRWYQADHNQTMLTGY